MISFGKLFAGILILFTISLVGVFGLPYLQLGNLQPQVDDDVSLPPGTSGLAKAGAHIYAANGCVYCHTQQVRPPEFGGDIARGWGKRHTVARDYLNDRPLLLGLLRTGPDLTNIGVRQPDAQWHYKHLYNPKSVVPWSIMPAHAFLFKVQKIQGQRSEDAVDLEGEDAPPEGSEVVPTYEAKALVHYLLSLNKNYSLPESPAPVEAPKK